MPKYILLFAAITLWAQDKKPVEKLAPYLPTPNTIVDRMLKFAEVKPNEEVWDLGSGDGRIVIAAARDYKAIAIGVEFDYDLFHESEAKIKKDGLKRARIILGDIFDQNYSTADVLTIYLLPSSNDKLQPLLERQLKKGARVVCHDFPFRDWTPAKIETIDDDGEGRSHTLYLYQR